MRLLSCFAALAIVTISSTATADTSRDELSPWEGSHTATGIAKGSIFAATRFKLRFRREWAGHFRRTTPLARLVGTIERCKVFLIGSSEIEACSGERAATIHLDGSSPGLFVLKTSEIVRLLHDGTTERVTTTSEEPAGTLGTLDGGALTIANPSMFLWTEPEPIGNAGYPHR